MNMGKLVCEILVNGEMQTKTLTTASTTDMGSFVKLKPGVGKPFYYFNSLPGTVLAADYEGAPVVSEDATANRAVINEMLANPGPYLEKLTFA